MAAPSEKLTTDIIAGRGIIRNEVGLYLLGRRWAGSKYEPFAWEHFGGQLDRVKRMDSDVLAATIAEIHEESGYVTELISGDAEGIELESRPLRDFGDGRPTGGSYSVRGFNLRIIGGEPLAIMPEHIEMGWFTKEGALALPLTPASRASFSMSVFTDFHVLNNAVEVLILPAI